jgi:hypothetical protein
MIILWILGIYLLGVVLSIPFIWYSYAYILRSKNLSWKLWRLPLICSWWTIICAIWMIVAHALEVRKSKKSYEEEE